MSVKLFTPRRFTDDRGWFSETWNKKAAAASDINDDFCQDNHSMSLQSGTIRGLHYQKPPMAQAKLVRCIKGAIFDVAVDVRRDSPTYLQWTSAILTAVEGNQLYIPIGYAHGFQTLEANCEVAYKVNNYYAPEADGGIIWNDPDINIAWPLMHGNIILSNKDAILPLAKNADLNFGYDGVPLTQVQ